MENLTVMALGFFSAFTGALFGILLVGVSKKLGRRGEGMLAGFTAGLLLAFVCFKILEEGFGAAPLHVGVLGIIAGAFAAAALDGALPSGKNAASHASVITAAGVMLHHFPEGIALGGLYAASPKQGLALAAIIAFHCIPEAAAVFIPVEGSAGGRRGIYRFLPYAVAISAPMAAGSLLGALLTEFSNAFQAFSLTFSGGVMLYITCGEMLPDSKQIWNGRLTSLSAAFGFILGVVITA